MKRSGAFTLVELLVVISIIGMLASLILPAVNMAREAGRRTSCVNNLKQSGLAVHLYADACRVLPSGWVGFDSAGRPAPLGSPGWGWCSALLPYLEQNNLYEHVHYDKSLCDEANQTAVTFPLKMFRCASDSGEEKFSFENFLKRSGSGYDNGFVGHSHDAMEFAISNYVGSFGTTEMQSVVNVLDSKFVSDGAFCHNSFFSVAAFLDGLGNTILIGERTTDVGYATWSGIPEGEACSIPLIVGSVSVKFGRSGGHASGFSSNHPGGANFTFGDGSVHWLSDTIEKDLLKALSTRRGGEVVSIP
jgi:prepilin-type N-terminal cleavage/methylation domain-containing protein/prepilin-type processing-associated H-X9-DG protein